LTVSSLRGQRLSDSRVLPGSEAHPLDEIAQTLDRSLVGLLSSAISSARTP
jgi:hypothetical protein